ncbi:hypothetical protein [Kitasatospora kifunensis]|uniref:Uncharacterized protein n=1 Tax=Kitasatospora kifunensis TaxID=58351 RepID=A0A7W7R7X1_KITKI|nr:hypothetical protein [Kitasatospora kifunensis]MBB4927021.1 hypothetical protein [Kitasatospora kifunensis]
MTTQGDSHPIPADPADPSMRVRTGARGGARRLLLGSVTVVALGAAGWVVSSPHPGDWLPGLGPSSKDVQSPSVIGSPLPTSQANPNPFDVKRLFPATRPIDLENYKGKLAAAQQGPECVQALQDTARALLPSGACQGYLAVEFSRQDGKVVTSATVLRFASDQDSAKVAQLMRGQGTVVRWVQADGNFATDPSTPAAPTGPASPPATGPSPTPAPTGPAAKADQPPRVEAVRHYVTVTSSRFQDGHSAATPQDQQDLDQATRAVSYTVGAAFIWS